jgi:hypothetical protein
MPFFRVIVLPLVVYWILVIIILFLWQDSMFKSHKGHGDDRDSKDSVWASGKSKDIFDDHSGYDGSGSKHEKIPARDKYDVDESGNLKGVGRKHKSFDSDNDGYVELK